MDQFNAQYHLPGLFEFYALYRLFLPLFQSFFCIFFRKTVFDSEEQVAVSSWT